MFEYPEMVFEYAGFVYRNPPKTTKEARRAWSTVKAMRKYRKEVPFCEGCNRFAKLQVHHLVPVSVDPDLAGEPSNMITLCRPHHLYVAHWGSWTTYVKNIYEVLGTAHVIKTKKAA